MSIHTAIKYLSTPQSQVNDSEILSVIIQWEKELIDITEKYQQRLNNQLNEEQHYWTNLEGRTTLISKMTDDHLRNVLALPYVHNNVKYQYLLKEWVKRFPMYHLLVGNQYVLLTGLIEQYGGFEKLNTFKKYINSLMSY